MLQSTYRDQVCSLAGALEVVGERWTLLIVRDVFLGLRRFEELQQELGVARNVLATRLEKLVDAGILEKAVYSERPLRHEYRLTEAGIDLWPVIHSLLRWGDAHAAPDAGPAVLMFHKACGGPVDEHRTCARCGERLTARDVVAKPGPGATEDHPLRARLA
jgi:DNA-binding HxlR family transcriptional regulator